MAPKRKRESSGSRAVQTPESINKAGPSSTGGVGGDGNSTSTPTLTDRKGKGKELDTDRDAKDGPLIHYSTADGARWWSKRIDLKKDLKKSLKKIAKEVGLSKEQAGELRLAHIRDGGREADIWDDFDYDAFKNRVIANPAAYFAVKVYTPGSSRPLVAPSLVPTTPTLHVQPTPAPTPTTTKKGKKRAQDRMGDASKDSPTTTSTAQQNGPTQSKSATPAKKTVKQSKKSDPVIAQDSETPASTPPVKGPGSSASPDVSSEISSVTSKKSKKASTAQLSPSTPSIPSGSSSTEPKKRAEARTSAEPQITASSIPVPNQTTSTPAPNPTVKQSKEKKARKSSVTPIVANATLPSPEPSSAEKTTSSPTATLAEVSPSTMTESQIKTKKERRRNKRKGSHESTPNPSESRSASPVQSAPSTPSPLSSTAPKSHIAMKFADRYKPARPSPLRSTTADDSPSTSSPPSKHRRRRERKRLRQSMNDNERAATTPRDAEGQHTTADTTSTQAERQNNSTAPEQTMDQASPPRKKARQETSTPSKVSKSQNLTTNRDSMQAKRTEVESTTTTDEPMVSTSAATTSEAPKSPKKIVRLSAEYDLYRKPNDSSTDSSSIIGEPRTQVTEEAQNSNSSTSEERSKSTEVEDVDMEEPSTTGSEVLVPETVDAPSTGNVDIVPETLPALTAPTDQPASLPPADVPNSDDTTPATESEAAPKPTQQILTPKKQAPRGRKLVETPKTSANGNAPVAALITSDSGIDVSMTNGHAVEETGSAPAPRQGETSAVNDHAENRAPAIVAETLPVSTTSQDSAPQSVEITAAPVESIAPEETPLPSASATKPVKARATKGRTSKAAAKDTPCIICFQTPSHFQKDCPEVKAGLENLRYLLVARQDQQSSVRDGEDGSIFAESVALIEVWIRRFTEIANKVEGVSEESAFKPRSPFKVMGTKTGQTIDLNAPAKPSGLVRGNRQQAATPPPAPVASTDSDVIMASPEPVLDTSNNDQVMSEDTSSPANGASPVKDQTTPSPPEPVPDSQISSLPAIHLKAMLKMQKSRRTGSLSGLSVSDAFIETEPSDESSSDSDEDGGADEDDEDTRSDAGSEVSSSSSMISSSSAVSSDSDNTTASATSRVPMPTNPSNAISYSLTRELSEREKKKARLSAAKMVPVAYDAQSLVDDADGDVDEPSEPPSPVKPRLTYARAGSESSIGDFGDDTSRRSSLDSTGQPPYMSQAPPIIASSSTQDVVPEPSQDGMEPGNSEDRRSSRASSAVPANESQPVKDIVQSTDERMSVDPTPTPETEATKTPRTVSRNFRSLRDVAGSSPDIDDSPGAQAVRQGIAEDEGSIDIEMDGSTIDSDRPLPVATQIIPLSQIHSAPTESSNGMKTPEEDRPGPIIPSSQPRRSSRTSVTASPAQSGRQSLGPDTPRRRLRSASRDLNDSASVPPASARSTRSVSRSKTSMSPSTSTNTLNTPSTPKAGTLAGRSILPEIEEAEAEQSTPKPARRSARATQASQLDSSLPITQEASLPESSQPEPVPSAETLEPQTQSTPVRQSRNKSASPLFMTQGSQIPATQYYEPHPETIPPESESASQAAQEVQEAVPATEEVPAKKPRGRPKGSKAQPKSSAPTLTQDEESTLSTPKAAVPKKTAAARVKATKAGKKTLTQTTEEPIPTPSQATESTEPTAPAQSTDTQQVQSTPIPNAQRSPSKSMTPPTSGQPNQSDRESDSSSDSEAYADADADVDDIPDIPPPTIRHVPSSSRSQTTAPIYPSLSQLPKDLLRRSLNFFGAGGGGGSNNRQPQPQTPTNTRHGNGTGTTLGKNMMNGHGHGLGTGNGNGGGESDSDSGSGSDSSDDETKFVPSAIKSRFASGGMGKKKAASQPAGW